MDLIRSLMSATGKDRSTRASPSTVPSRWKKPTPEENSTTWPIDNCVFFGPSSCCAFASMTRFRERGDDQQRRHANDRSAETCEQPLAHEMNLPESTDSSLYSQDETAGWTDSSPTRSWPATFQVLSQSVGQPDSH